MLRSTQSSSSAPQAYMYASNLLGNGMQDLSTQEQHSTLPGLLGLQLSTTVTGIRSTYMP